MKKKHSEILKIRKMEKITEKHRKNIDFNAIKKRHVEVYYFAFYFEFEAQLRCVLPIRQPVSTAHTFECCFTLILYAKINLFLFCDIQSMHE